MLGSTQEETCSDINGSYMSKENYKRHKCPIAKSLSIIGDQWTLLIVRDALRGTDRFEGFQSSLGISRNLLTKRLKDLVENDMLSREEIPGSKRFAYKVTPKCRDLGMTLSALAGWGDRWMADEKGPRIVLKDRQTEAAVKLGYYRIDDHAILSPRDVVSQPGPGASLKLIEKLSR
jgi:DNA-binding HxlR family transcriptional regulator